MSRLRFLDNGAKYPKETRRIELGDYHEDLAGDFIDVWVNFPRRLSNERLALAQESIAISEINLGEERDKRLDGLQERMFAFQSEWWGLEVEQVKALYDVDTTLYGWIVTQAAKLRADYEDSRKKVDDDSTDT